MGYIILSVLALLCLILVLRALSVRKQARPLSSSGPSFSETDTMQQAGQLAAMLRCRTVSVKDTFDDAAFSDLRTLVQEQFPLFHKQAERMIFSDDCWIYCLKGADETRNIMLMSHHDVVDVSDHWQHDPFGGEISDGKLWGRGAVDTKTPLFSEFYALESLLKEGWQPPCNVWLGSSHNEELGGDGIPKALDYFQSKGITFEVILDEGGAVIDPVLGGMLCKKNAAIAVHEKGRYYLNCTAETNNSHISLTAAENASPVERMSSFVRDVTSSRLYIRRLNPQVKAMFRHLAPYCSFPMCLLFSNLWLFGPLLKAVMPKLNPQAAGMIGTTGSCNRIEGGKTNCTAEIVLRFVDGEDGKQDLDTVLRTAKQYGISVEIDPKSEYHAPADMEKPQFAYLKDCIAAIFPQYPAIPMILPAGTDARTLTDICPCVLRFAPILLTKEQLASVHSEDENISLEAIPLCTAFYRHFLVNYK